jgi:hypothetical protein
MTQKDTQTQPVQQQPAPKKPNDTGSISVEGFVRIFDPETKEVFVEKRA